MSRSNPNSSEFFLSCVNMREHTEHPEISFNSPLTLIAHVNATYPDYTSYLITVVRRSNTKS